VTAIDLPIDPAPEDQTPGSKISRAGRKNNDRNIIMEAKMGQRSLLVIATLSLVLLAAGPIDKQENGVWRADFKQAFGEAVRKRRPLLLHFHASWCPPCHRMERDVFSSKEFRRRLSLHFVALKVDVDAETELAKRFGIRDLPADVIIDPSGRVILETKGYQAKAVYLAKLDRIARQFQRDELSHDSPPRSKQSRAKTQTSIGMDGYSPVSLYVSRSWQKGKRKFSMDYQGVTFLMVSEIELRQFQREPGRYAPRLLSCDPVVLWESDRCIPGDTRFGAYFDDELFFFVSAKSRNKFKQRPLRYTRARHALTLPHNKTIR
jgi:thioredoxin-related protein/YHS domain-containing protein